MCRDILSIMSPKLTFANAVAEHRVLWRILTIVERPEFRDDSHGEMKDDAARRRRTWSLLDSLVSSPSVAMQVVHSSAWLELLGIVAGYSKFTKSLIARHGAAKTLSGLCWDTSTGPFIGTKETLFVSTTVGCYDFL